MAILIEVGHYSLSKSVKSVLRARLDATLATLGGTVTDYLPEDLQGAGSNVYLSDDRIPPQARQYLLLSVEHTADERVISLGPQNSTYEIRILSAVRGTQTARSGSDPAPTSEDATKRVRRNRRGPVKVFRAITSRPRRADAVAAARGRRVASAQRAVPP